jgi:hypothetical protein
MDLVDSALPYGAYAHDYPTSVPVNDNAYNCVSNCVLNVQYYDEYGRQLPYTDMGHYGQMNAPNSRVTSMHMIEEDEGTYGNTSGRRVMREIIV